MGVGIFIIMIRNTKRVWERIRKTKYKTGKVRPLPKVMLDV